MQKEDKVCNITPANRVGSVQEYYFSKKLKEVAEMNAAGKNVINLGVGSPDLPPSEQTIETLCEHARKANEHGYQPYVGIPELRKGFADWYKTWYDVDLDPKTEIQPLIGSKEGILHISLAFLNPGDGVLVPNPGYPTYSSVSKLVEARLIPYELKEELGWQPDFEELEKMDLSNVKLMWTNYPNMPTGANASVELYEKLVAFGRKHGIIICNDNPYSFILNEHPLSILSIPGAKEICIEMNSMSKAHNMPGWRMAMLASNAQFVQWILKVKSNIDSGQFKPMQYAAVEALSAKKEWYDNMNRVYRSRRDLAGQIMRTLGCEYDENQVGMFLWGRIPDSAESGEAIANKVLYEANVFLTPGYNGAACRNLMPGPGAKGIGDTAIRNYNKWKEIRINMDTIAENVSVDTSLEIFGRKFKYPFMAGPVGAVQLHYGDCLDDVRYNDILVSACARGGIAAFTGDGTDGNVMIAATKAIRNADGVGIPTVKPWNIDTIRDKIKLVKESGAFAVAMDIDAAGLPFLKNLTPPAGSKTVEELREIIEMVDVPFIIKGIMTAKGAIKAKEAGASAIVVSNHGGRVLDGCPATAEVLEEISDAVNGSMKIFVDGGIRSGADVFRALALGADGVIIARPFVTAVYGGAEEGVYSYIDKIGAELNDTMKMCGVSRLSEITRDCVRM